MRPTLVPATHDLDLTMAMATMLRVNGLSFDGSVEKIVRDAFQILWKPTNGGYTYAVLKPRILEAIDLARLLGPINLETADA
jgi:hypothetical protein